MLVDFLKNGKSTSLSSIFIPSIFQPFPCLFITFNFQLSILFLCLLVSPIFSNFAVRLPQFLTDSTRKD